MQLSPKVFGLEILLEFLLEPVYLYRIKGPDVMGKPLLWLQLRGVKYSPPVIIPPPRGPDDYLRYISLLGLSAVQIESGRFLMVHLSRKLTEFCSVSR